MDSRSGPSIESDEHESNRRSPLPDSGYYSPRNEQGEINGTDLDQPQNQSQVFTFDVASSNAFRTTTPNTVSQSAASHFVLDHTRGSVYNRRMSSIGMHRRNSEPNSKSSDNGRFDGSYRRSMSSIRFSDHEIETSRRNALEDQIAMNASTSSKFSGSARPVAIVRPLTPEPPRQLDQTYVLIGNQLRTMADGWEFGRQLRAAADDWHAERQVRQWPNRIIEEIVRALLAILW